MKDCIRVIQDRMLRKDTNQKLYIDDNLWIRQPNRALLLGNRRFPSPSTLLLPDVLVIIPDVLLATNVHLKCSRCDHKLVSKGEQSVGPALGSILTFDGKATRITPLA